MTRVLCVHVSSRGKYEIQIQSPEFRPYSRTGLVIDIGSALIVDVRLGVGEHVDQVMVAEGGTQVEATSTQMGYVVTGTKVTAISTGSVQRVQSCAVLRACLGKRQHQQPRVRMNRNCGSAANSAVGAKFSF
jgi:hypothetical protein